MLNGELRSQIDSIWNDFWTGGISNPMNVIQQMTYLLFIKRLDELHTSWERQKNIGAEPTTKPVFTDDQQELRWSRFKDFDPEKMFKTVQQGVFEFIKGLNGNLDSSYTKFMKDAVFMIPTPQLLDKVVGKLDKIDVTKQDTKGDLYEYMLNKLSQAGTNGQFRTPKHIRRLMVDLMQPDPMDNVCDPACGTAGFLVSVIEYLQDKHGFDFYMNDEWKENFQTNLLTAMDFDTTMLQIAAMNLVLHGIDDPNVIYADSLDQRNADIKDTYSLILANPPFKGSIDYDNVAPDLLKMTKTKKTELLFLALFLRTLKAGGRCACIVPDGVLFGSGNAYKDIRKEIVENHKLDAVISMPSGVFKPYAGVSTAILIFTKTNSGGTEKVWFYDMLADGYSLDDKRNQLDHSKHEENNLPDIVNRFNNLSAEENRTKKDQSFMVDISEIKDNDYDLSINRYKEIEYEEVEYEDPKKIVSDLMDMEDEIKDGLEALNRMLG